MSQIIEKEGKHYIQGKVVMIASNRESKLYLMQGDKRNTILCRSSINYKQESFPNQQNQHLYITSDDKIKEDDWCYDSKHNIVFKCDTIAPYTVCKDDSKHISLLDDNLKRSFEIENCKKIIATTDTSLGLPSPSESFIKAYIEAYNNGNVIDDVLVEYESIYADRATNTWEFILKLKDSNIIIKKVKDKLECNRSQLLKLVHDVGDYIEDKNSTEFNIDKWIEENL
jgi:hypothetical protein